MARIKYFNSVTGQWEYADSQYSTGSGGNVDLTGVVKSVNGAMPDENGNVEITASGVYTLAEGETIEDVPPEYDVVIDPYAKLDVGDIGGATPKQLYTFLDAYTAWSNGESFPIAFYGDSTFHGNTTTSEDNRFCAKLQKMLREECGPNATIYRVGLSGKNLNDAISQFKANFIDTRSDTKMIGIGFGINDRLGNKSYKKYRDEVYANLETLINMCYDKGIQPFLVTSQATMECGVATEFNNPNDMDKYHPLRDSNTINVYANGAKKDLSRKYNIPLLDLNKATEDYLMNSLVPANQISSDRLHFGDIGHNFEAGYLFSEIVSRVIHVESDKETIISYASQNLRYAVPEETLKYGGDFKVYASYDKDNTGNEKIFDAYVFIKDHPATLTAYKYDGGNTHVKIDGTEMSLTTLRNNLGKLDLGLHHLEVYSSEKRVVFNGFVLNEDIRCDGGINGSVLLDTTKVNGTDSTFANMSSANVPAVIAPNFNAETKTTSLSGTTITAIYCAFRFTGNITIGKVNLEEYGTGSVTLIGAKSYAVDHDRFHVIEIDPIELGDHETLAIGYDGDSARLHFLNNFSDESARIYTSSNFKAGGGANQGMRIKVYGNTKLPTWIGGSY